jgi:hypothetical protein
MDVTAEPVIDISQPQLASHENSTSTLGVCALVSEDLFNLRRKANTNTHLHALPYSESLYAFPSTLGTVYTLEQLFVSKYTVSVPKAILHLVLQVSVGRLKSPSLVMMR